MIPPHVCAPSKWFEMRQWSHNCCHLPAFQYVSLSRLLTSRAQDGLRKRDFVLCGNGCARYPAAPPNLSGPS